MALNHVSLAFTPLEFEDGIEHVCCGAVFSTGSII
jgi:hypothetical protein